MKFRVTFKTPDAVEYACREQVLREIEIINDSIGNLLTGEEIEAKVEERVERALNIVQEWVEYNEMITVEFNTNRGTATVVSKRDE